MTQHVPTFHFSIYFIYFFHLLFSEKHLVVIVFFMFCPVSGLVGWLWQLLFIRRVSDISHTLGPRIISSPVEIPQSGIQHGSFLEVAPTCPNLSCFPLLFFMFFIRRVPDISHCPRIISSPVNPGRDCFFHVLSCFYAGWVVVAATFLFEGFQTSHIPLE